MSKWCAWLILLTCACTLPLASRAAEPALRFTQHEDRVQFSAGDRPLATYVWHDAEIQRPYLAHVCTLGGVQVTRNHPPIEGTDRTDHATFHPGVWLAFGDISGEDFWRNKADVVHQEFVVSPHTDSRGGGFTVRNDYVADGRTLSNETCSIRLDWWPSGYVITWDSTFSGDKEFVFGDQEEMGLGVRVATPLAVKSGGRIVDSEGRVNESQVWGQPSAWCDDSGTIDGKHVGVALFADPKNFRVPWIHARDYGLLVANPFGENAFTKGPKSRVVVRRGATLRIRFGVFVHEGDVEPSAAYGRWVANLPPRE